MVTLLFHFSKSVFPEGGTNFFGGAKWNHALPQNDNRIVNSVIIKDFFQSVSVCHI